MARQDAIESDQPQGEESRAPEGTYKALSEIEDRFRQYPHQTLGSRYS